MALGDATSTFAVDNSQDWPVVVNSPYCRRVYVQENTDSLHPSTVDLLQKQPATAGAIRIARGTSAIYTPVGRKFFNQGETVGTIRTASGSITAQQIESLWV